jgi:Ser/Thr protein kinase RdoA (MazF antagonist)
MTAIPASAPVPRLQWSYDDGDWVMLVLDDVDGVMPAIPWHQDELTRVMSALGQLATTLTPAPASTLPITADLADSFRSWHVIMDAPALAGQLGDRERAHLPHLASLESGWAAAAQGSTLLHADLRADNLLLTRDGGVMVIDWPYAVSGAAWVDALLFLISATADGGTDPEEAWSGYEPTQQAEPGAVNAMIAAAAGDFTYQSLLPAPQNMPALREHQRAKGAAAACWQRSRPRWP